MHNIRVYLTFLTYDNVDVTNVLGSMFCTLLIMFWKFTQLFIACSISRLQTVVSKPEENVQSQENGFHILLKIIQLLKTCLSFLTQYRKKKFIFGQNSHQRLIKMYLLQEFKKNKMSRLKTTDHKSHNTFELQGHCIYYYNFFAFSIIILFRHQL